MVKRPFTLENPTPKTYRQTNNGLKPHRSVIMQSKAFQKNTRQLFTDNTVVREFLMQHSDIYDTSSYSNINSNIDDIITGAINVVTWGTRTPTAYRVFTMLTYMDSIDQLHVSTHLDRKRLALYGTTSSIRTLQRWVTVLSCASKGIKHMLEVSANLRHSRSLKATSNRVPDNLPEPRKVTKGYNGNVLYDEWCYKGAK